MEQLNSSDLGEGADRSISDAPSIESFPLRIILSTGEKLLEKKRYRIAERVFKTALQKRPWSIRGLTGLGIACNAMNRADEAAHCFARVMSYRPNLPKAMEGFGHASSIRENYAEAESWFRRASTIAPTARSVSIALGVTKLRLGDWQLGFPLYDQREGVVSLERSIGKEKHWDGHADLNGKTILVVGEQGYGDHIQFVRYCALLKEKGAHVVFFTREPLRQLVEWIPFIDKVVTDGQKTSFDYAVMIMSLPGLFGTVPECIPLTSAYICPPLDRMVDKPRKTKKEPQLLIAWKGNPENSRNEVRSCPAEIVASLIENTNRANFQALPFDLLSEKNNILAALPALCDGNATFADVALALDEIDLIITVDTSLAHLGGALGKLTWLLIGKQPDWRWLAAGEESLWYDSVRLFRMEEDWPQLMGKIEDNLDRFLDDLSQNSRTSE